MENFLLYGCGHVHINLIPCNWTKACVTSSQNVLVSVWLMKTDNNFPEKNHKVQLNEGGWPWKIHQLRSTFVGLVEIRFEPMVTPLIGTQDTNLNWNRNLKLFLQGNEFKYKWKMEFWSGLKGLRFVLVHQTWQSVIFPTIQRLHAYRSCCQCANNILQFQWVIYQSTQIQIYKIESKY